MPALPATHDPPPGGAGVKDREVLAAAIAILQAIVRLRVPPAVISARGEHDQKGPALPEWLETLASGRTNKPPVSGDYAPSWLHLWFFRRMMRAALIRSLA